jgi:hypothetical protein
MRPPLRSGVLTFSRFAFPFLDHNMGLERLLFDHPSEQ